MYRREGSVMIPMGAMRGDGPPYVLDLLPACPWRPVDWRWQLACLRARGERRLRRLDDEAVRRAARFLRTIARLGRARAESHDPAVAAALRLHDVPDGWDRQAIECYILAGLDDSEIAARVGLPVETVEVYVELYFDVRSNLTSPDRVMFVAVDPEMRLHSGIAGPEVVAKLLAYTGGPLVTDVVLGLLADVPAPSTPPVPGPREWSDVAAGLRMLTALLTTPAEGKAAIAILRLYERMLEIERDEAARSAMPVSLPVLTALPDAILSSFLPKPAHASETDGPDPARIRPEPGEPGAIEQRSEGGPVDRGVGRTALRPAV
jgi:hypothetical protein